MSDVSSLARLVPGFDFLQGLVKNAGSALPNIGQWVAPTLDPEELEKRIEELRTVQFWLEQNAKMLGATIQALEVQRMTLATLKTMNVQMSDLREALTIRLPEGDAEPPAEARPAAAPAAKAPAAAPAKKPRKAARPGASAPAAAEAAAAATLVDPMQWWNALTKQFGELAATAMKDGAADVAKNLAGAVVKQTVGSAGQALKTVAGAPAKAARKAATPRRRKAAAAG